MYRMMVLLKLINTWIHLMKDFPMLELLELKAKLLQAGIANKNGKLYSKSEQVLLENAEELIACTNFLPSDALLKQRWFHVDNNLSHDVLCKFCLTRRTSWKTLSYRLTCSKSCHSKLKGILSGKTRKGDIAKASYALSRRNMLAKDPLALKKLGQKAAITAKVNGYEIRTMKSAVTKRTVLDNGLTIAQNARFKQIENLKNSILPNGESKFSAVGKNISKVLTNNVALKNAMKKTGKIKSAIDSSGSSIASRAALKGVQSCRITKELNGSIIPKSLLTEWELYSREVQRITNSQPLHLLENFELRGNHATNKDAWHLDHKFSIAQGFLEGILPAIIGSFNNLRMLPWRENVSKGMKCSVTLHQIL